MLVFDTPRYINTLDWFGLPVDTCHGSVVLRRFGQTDWDAWGSWPYQTLPSVAHLQAMRDIPRYAPLAFTAVIRPDIAVGPTEAALSSIRSRFGVTFRALKTHLGHSPGLPPGRAHYSRRTRRRLEHAQRVFFVERERLCPEHGVMATWQSRLRASRFIHDLSSPDQRHFACLITLSGRHPEDVACIALRRRDTARLAGVFLFFAARGGQGWHAHSFLVDDGVRQDFGTSHLFDQAIALLGDQEIWFGGAPSGANGPGVFTFKKKFANCLGQAHILCVDLHEGRLRAVRHARETTAWLPDYRTQR